MKSSLTYQVLLHLGSYFFGFYCLVVFLLLIYKSIGKQGFVWNTWIIKYKCKKARQISISLFLRITVLPYPTPYFALEFSILVFLAIVEGLRIINGWKANLTENITYMGLSIVLFIPGILGIIYFLLWQVFVSYILNKCPFLLWNIV